MQQRSEVFVKNQKKIVGGRGRGVRVWGVRVDENEDMKFFFWGGGVRGGGSGWGGQGGCERRIEVFVKIQKKTFLGGGGWM